MIERYLLQAKKESFMKTGALDPVTEIRAYDNGSLKIRFEVVNFLYKIQAIKAVVGPMGVMLFKDHYGKIARHYGMSSIQASLAFIFISMPGPKVDGGSRLFLPIENATAVARLILRLPENRAWGLRMLPPLEPPETGFNGNDIFFLSSFAQQREVQPSSSSPPVTLKRVAEANRSVVSAPAIAPVNRAPATKDRRREKRPNYKPPEDDGCPDEGIPLRGELLEIQSLLKRRRWALYLQEWSEMLEDQKTICEQKPVQVTKPASRSACMAR